MTDWTQTTTIPTVSPYTVPMDNIHRLSELFLHQKVYVTSRNLSFILKARVNDVRPADIIGYKGYVYVKFVGCKELEGARKMLIDESVNHLNALSRPQPYVIATDLYILKKLSMMILKQQRAEFSSLMSKIIANPNLVGAKDDGEDADVIRLKYIDLSIMDVQEIHASKRNLGKDLSNLSRDMLRYIYGFHEDILGGVLNNHNIGLMPLPPLNHADKNFFEAAKKLYRQIELNQMKTITNFIEHELGTDDDDNNNTNDL